MDVPNRVFQLLCGLFAPKGIEELDIFVNRARDHVKIELLGHARLLEIVEREAFRRRIAQPLFNRNAIAFGFADLFAILIQEQLIAILNRRLGP